MVEQNEIEKYAESAYLFVAEDRRINFSTLLNSVKSFYYQVAMWHLSNEKLEENLSKIASRIFDGVMFYEEKRREEQNPSASGGLFASDEKVKRMYFNLAKWHIGKMNKN